MLPDIPTRPPFKFESKVTRCLLSPRDGDTSLFYVHDGIVEASLDGYAIIPMEEYDRLLVAAGEAWRMTPMRSHGSFFRSC